MNGAPPLLSCSYRTLAERCLGIRAVYARPHMNRAIAFDYMNRQLVWTELSVSEPHSSCSEAGTVPP